MTSHGSAFDSHPGRYVAGDCGFDPLGLYGWYGSNLGVMDQMRAEKDVAFAMQLSADARKEMETAELKNGRLAMIAITWYAAEEFLTKASVVNDTPFLFKSIL